MIFDLDPYNSGIYLSPIGGVEWFSDVSVPNASVRLKPKIMLQEHLLQEQLLQEQLLQEHE